MAKARETKTKDISLVRCIKSVDNRILIKDKEIKERWRYYFGKLLNENPTKKKSLLKKYN